jgi:hypothetical protein
MRVFADLFARTALCLSVTSAVVAFLYHPTVVPENARDTRIELGLFLDDGRFVPTDVVPLEVGTTFGWRLHVTDDRPVSWHEELTAPAPPREWLGDDFVVVDSGRTAISDHTVAPVDGVIEHAWIITEGDPAGMHELRVFVDDALAADFHFVVR